MGRVFTVLGEGTVHLAVSLLGDTLEPDTLDVVVEATGADAMALMAFALDDPVELMLYMRRCNARSRHYG